MEQSLKIVQYSPEKSEVTCSEILSDVSIATLAPFDKRTIEFLNQLSLLLLADKSLNRNPEIVSLAFWLRKSNVSTLHKENTVWLTNPVFRVIPIGTVFHIAPSNVDTIFLYSTCISLLMGNRNIVRLSSGIAPSVSFITDCLNTILSKPEYHIFREFIKLIGYGHDDLISIYFSTRADCRVIWGGDQTVLHFKSLPAKASLKDIVFPNRVSHSLIHAGVFLSSSDAAKNELAKHFFNDAYVFDQLGCSSPRIIYLLGNEQEKEAFTTEFYFRMTQITQERYAHQTSALSSVKFNHLVDDVLKNPSSDIIHKNNSLYLIEVSEPPVSVENCVGGFFYLNRLSKLSELGNLLPESTQTLSYFGFSKADLEELTDYLSGKRVDRICPVGQALSFHYIWDGMNLFEQLSRKRSVI